MKGTESKSYAAKYFITMGFASHLSGQFSSEKFHYGPLMAPEVEAGEDHGIKADIWSFGQLAI